MPTPTTPQVLSDARYTVIADLGRGESVEQTASYLVMNGWDEPHALDFVRRIKQAMDLNEDPPRPWEQVEGHVFTEEEYRAIARQDARAVSIRNMQIGGLWILGGVVVTAFTYMIAAQDGGGRYVITSGAFIYGLIRFGVGFSGLLQANKLPR